jgi:predicted nucleic acid-binding protein
MSPGLVLDSSLALSWCFETEATEAADAMLASLAAGATAYVPALWAWEVNNVLCLAEKNGRHSSTQRRQKLALLEGLPIEVDNLALKQAWRDTSHLALAHSLSVYDAAYLEMALRLKLALGSLDERLRAAARKAGADCLPGDR